MRNYCTAVTHTLNISTARYWVYREANVARYVNDRILRLPSRLTHKALLYVNCEDYTILKSLTVIFSGCECQGQ